MGERGKERRGNYQVVNTRRRFCSFFQSVLSLFISLLYFSFWIGEREKEWKGKTKKSRMPTLSSRRYICGRGCLWHLFSLSLLKSFLRMAGSQKVDFKRLGGLLWLPLLALSLFLSLLHRPYTQFGWWKGELSLLLLCLCFCLCLVPCCFLAIHNPHALYIWSVARKYREVGCPRH